MKKGILGILAVVVLVGIGFYLYNHNNVETINDKPTIKIGVSLPLTGVLANVGTAGKASIMIAQDDISKKNLKNNYEIIIEDDAFEVRKAVSNFHKFQSIDGVDAVISFASATGNAISPLTERTKTIYVNYGASDKNVAKGKYNFIHWNMPEDVVRGLLDFLAKKNYKKAAFVAENDAGVIVIEKSFAEISKEYLIENKAFFVQPKEKDFRLLLSKIEKEYNPDVYIVMIWTESLPQFVKQYKEARIDKPITNMETFALYDDLSALEGAYYVDSSQSSDFLMERIYKKDPTISNHFSTGNVYDSIMMIVEAFERADTKEQAVDELVNLKEFEGVMKTLKQDDEGIFRSDAVIKIIRNGKSVTVKE